MIDVDGEKVPLPEGTRWGMAVFDARGAVREATTDEAREIAKKKCEAAEEKCHDYIRHTKRCQVDSDIEEEAPPQKKKKTTKKAHRQKNNKYLTIVADFLLIAFFVIFCDFTKRNQVSQWITASSR